METASADYASPVPQPALTLVNVAEPTLEERLARLEAGWAEFHQRYLHLLQMMIVVGGTFQETARALLDEAGR